MYDSSVVSDEAPEVRPINRRLASSGKVDYGDAVVIHDSGRTQVQFVPFFIPHRTRTELAGKIITYQKRPFGQQWLVVEEKSLSLTGDSASALYRALRDHLQVVDEGDGRFLVIEVGAGVANVADHDPQMVASALTRVLSAPEIVDHIAGADLSDELFRALRGAVRLKEMRDAVARLRQSLDSGEASESVYQEWCSNHSWAFGNAYVVTDDVRNISASDRTDLLMPRVISGYRDIVELKRPDESVLHYDEGHQNYYFAAEVSRAIGQCHRYLDVLHEEARDGLRDHAQVVAYHPRATIVIGRSHDWADGKSRALHGLNSRLNGITVMTYDHLLSYGDRLLEVLEDQGRLQPAEAVGGDVEFDLNDWLADHDDEEDLTEIDPDDLPF